MSVALEPKNSVLEVHATGKLERNDYEAFVPKVEQMIEEHGKIRVLLILDDFHGWETGALWEDIKFDVKHFNDIERLAIVGDKKWERGMAGFCKPFTTARIKYFDKLEIDQARQWVQASE